MVGRRLKEIAAMTMIGEGIIGALFPRRHTLLWKFGPKKYRRFIEASAMRTRGRIRFLVGLETNFPVGQHPFSPTQPTLPRMKD